MPSFDQYRDDLDRLVRLAQRDLASLALWGMDAESATRLLLQVMPELTQVYGSAAATLAADWYDDLRAEQGIKGRFRAIVAETPGTDATNPLVRWAVDPLFSADPDPAAAITRAEGGLQRVVADVGRQTVMDSTAADPEAMGWQRVATAGCGFCRMLASRGAVYTKNTVSFGAHDHCKCLAAPAWDGHALPVEPYVPSPSDVTQADRDRTRRWMRANGFL